MGRMTEDIEILATDDLLDHAELIAHLSKARGHIVAVAADGPTGIIPDLAIASEAIYRAIAFLMGTPE